MFLSAEYGGNHGGKCLDLPIIHGDSHMECFFTALLEEFVSSAFLEKVRIKFHFAEEQTAAIGKVAKEMLPVLRKEAFWVSAAYKWKECPHLAGNTETVYETTYEKVAMSLGNGVDLLQESYSQTGLLLQSYIVETLSGELLMRGYDAYNRYIAAHTDRHVARYHFPGSEDSFPLEMLPELLKNLTQEITCNAAYCMIPKKSVVFISELTQDETVHCQGICAGCGNMTCPNRVEENSLIRKRMTDMPLTYGYSRIFGIKT